MGIPHDVDAGDAPCRDLERHHRVGAPVDRHEEREPIGRHRRLDLRLGQQVRQAEQEAGDTVGELAIVPTEAGVFVAEPRRARRLAAWELLFRSPTFMVGAAIFLFWVASAVMIAWAAGFCVVVLWFAVWQFRRRPL